VIDLHCHILPGIDDGPATVEGSLELAARAVAGGIRKVAATPHIDYGYGVGLDQIEPAVAELRTALQASEIDLELVGGGEIAISRLLELDDADLRRLALGDGPYLLVEAPLEPAVGDIESLIEQLVARGHGVVLAHPERSPPLQRAPDRIERMVEAGALCSITAGAIEGRFGGLVKGFALDLLERGLVHNVTSDAHDADRRPPDLVTWIEATDGRVPETLADWLTEDVPAAILSGQPLPIAPAPAGPTPGRRRRWPWSR